MNARLQTRLTAASIAVAAVALVALNRDLPIVRNGLVYAKITYNLLDSGFDLSAVAASSKLSFHRSLGFPLLAAPLVSALGANTGLMVASLVSGLAFLVACVGCFRHFNRRLEIDERWVAIELMLVFFNPLTMYQFWSAYPDMSLAALFVVSLWSLDRSLHDPDASPLWLVLTYAALYGAIVVKHYGLVLLPLHVAYIVHSRRAFVPNVLRRRRATFALCMLVLAGLFGTAVVGRNPTLHVSLDGGAPSFYVDGLKRIVQSVSTDWVDDEVADEDRTVVGATGVRDLLDSANQLAVFVVLVFGFTIVFVFSRRNLAAPARALALVIVLFCGGLLFYPYTWFNMRFFVPIAPFVALLIVNGMVGTPYRVARSVALMLLFAANALTTLNFNTRFGFSLFADFNEVVQPKASRPRSFPYFNIDCLRMLSHVVLRSEFDHVNATVPEAATLFMVQEYYDGALHDVYTRSGMFRADLNVEQFGSPSDVPWVRESCRKPGSCYWYGLRFREARPLVVRDVFTSRPWLKGGEWGLYRIERPLQLPTSFWAEQRKREIAAREKAQKEAESNE